MELEEARDLLLSAVKPAGKGESVALSQALGRRAFEDVTAPQTVPSFPRSAMDGYALRAGDLKGAAKDEPVYLKVLFEQDAGDAVNTPVPEGCAVRVMTGAMIPDDCDTVIKQEDTDYGEEWVGIYKAEPLGMNVCPVGESFKEGFLLVERGRVITRSDIGLLAMAGIDRILVYPKVRVALLSTGSELTAPGEKPGPGKIYASIGPMLYASVSALGGDVTEYALCPDDEDRLALAIQSALAASDLLVTTGGVSVGKKDLVGKVLEGLKAKRLFWHVNVQPGTPTLAAVVSGKPVLSLSGNPYAALANFDWYVPPLLAHMTGDPDPCPLLSEGSLVSPWIRAGSHRRLVRAKVCEGKVCFPEGGNKSSVITNLSDCNAYAIIPEGQRLEAGDQVMYFGMNQ